MGGGGLEDKHGLFEGREGDMDTPTLRIGNLADGDKVVR